MQNNAGRDITLNGFSDYGAIEYFAISGDRLSNNFILIYIKSHKAKLRTHKSRLSRLAKFI